MILFFLSLKNRPIDKDLAKALNVAKEIESAKQLVEEHHLAANHHNYETVDKGNKKDKK